MKKQILLATVSGLFLTGAALADGHNAVVTIPGLIDKEQAVISAVDLDRADLVNGSGLANTIDNTERDLGFIAGISDTIATDEDGNPIMIDGDPIMIDGDPIYEFVPVTKDGPIIYDPVLDDDGQPVIDDVTGNPVVTPRLDENGDPVKEQLPVLDPNDNPIYERVQAVDADGNPQFEQVQATDPDTGAPLFEQVPKAVGGTVKDSVEMLQDSMEQTDVNTAAIETNTGAIEVEKNRNDAQDIVIESNTANIEEVTNRISTAFEGFDAAAVNSTLKQVGVNTAAIAHNTSRIEALEGEIDGLKGGVAMAIAIANAPIVTNGENKFSLSGGMGYYEDAFALSLKAAFMPTNNIAITGSVASDMEDSFSAGAGIGFAF